MDSWKREAKPDAWDEPVSPFYLSKPTMNAFNTANVIRNIKRDFYSDVYNPFSFELINYMDHMRISGTEP